MKRNLIAIVLVSLASVQAGVASAALGVNGTASYGAINGVTVNGLLTNGVALKGSFPDRAINNNEEVAARPRPDCIREPEGCAGDAPRSRAPGVSVQTITLPDGSI